jgi:hypothetical protein
MPGAEELAFTMHTEIHGDAFQDVFGDIVLPTLDMTTEEYVLIDASTLATSQHLRTSCTLVVGTCDAGCIEDSWDCLPDIDTLSSMFTPSGMTALFGAR